MPLDQVQVMHAAFTKAKDDVHDAAERLRTDRNQIDGRVRGFLSADWSGEAADSFSDAWEERKRVRRRSPRGPPKAGPTTTARRPTAKHAWKPCGA